MADQVNWRIRREVIDDGLKVGHVIGEPVTTTRFARRVGAAVAALIRRDHVPVALHRVDQKLERGGNVHPAMKHEHGLGRGVAPGEHFGGVAPDREAMCGERFHGVLRRHA